MSLRIKRYYPILIILISVIGFLLLVMGNQRVIAYTTRQGIELPQLNSIYPTGNNFENSILLFDDSILHSINVNLSEEDYQQMITTYQETGEKEYFHAVFCQLYTEKLKYVYKNVYEDGSMEAQVETYANLIRANNNENPLVNMDEYNLAVDKIINFIHQRLDYIRRSDFDISLHSLMVLG